MSYAAGQTILDDEYNTFITGGADGTPNHAVANLNSLWGSGSGNLGYGQAGGPTSVSVGTTISATQWNSLLDKIENIGSHQNTAVATYSTLTASDTITAVATVSSNLTSIFNARNNANAFGTDITASGVSTSTSTWYTQMTHNFTVTFANDASQRYFFNAGGAIAFTFSRSGGTSNDKNTEWADLCTRAGTWYLTGSSNHTIGGVNYTGTTKIGGNSGGAGISITTINYHQLTTSPQIIATQYADTSPYTGNYITLSASLTSGNTPQLTFTVNMYDAAADTGNPEFITDADPASLDKVDGSMVVTMVAKQPATTVLSNTWGTPTLAASNSSS